MVETWRILPAQILGSARVSRAGDGVFAIASFSCAA